MQEQPAGHVAMTSTINALSNCAEILDALVATLLGEQQAFTERDTEALLAVAERKRALLEDLKRSAPCLVALPEAPRVLRERIEHSFERCRELNQVTGRFIAANRGATEKAIAALRGVPPPMPSYGRHGASDDEHGSRTLATA
ncbi:flagellar protein FlgN [Thioalkalivibrio sp. XN279]|uniref:flagellar protein FlgN n=1 Tax=Thioalkalivibrio sp. XN279 TaxID=2714953 RepID=UPI00140E6FA4|nr:flagellar protein FlgN [Thioalkalivibrio sp. XN279]NHA13391.1 flagellar protein FlgN [Thioalkalivibrio sp. XN279]